MEEHTLVPCRVPAGRSHRLGRTCAVVLVGQQARWPARVRAIHAQPGLDPR
ncbi:hypothetical protein [Comamonas sp.]